MSYVLQIITNKDVEFLRSMHILYRKRMITVLLQSFRSPPSAIAIEYRQDGEDTAIGRQFMKNEILVENDDFVSVFCDDLKSILLHKNTRLKVFSLINEHSGEEREEEAYRREYLDPIRKRIYQGVADTLKLREQKLQVRVLKLKITEENQITSILPYIDPSTVVRFYLKVNTDSDPTVSLAEMWYFLRLAKPKNVDISRNKLYPAMINEMTEAYLKYSKVDKIPNSEWTIMDLFRGRKIVFPSSDQEMLWMSEMSSDMRDVILIRYKIPKEEDLCYSYFDAKEDEDSRSDSNLPCLEETLQKKVFESDILLKKIVEYVGLLDIQRLRKVSRGIRQCINGIKLTTIFESWSFAMGFNKVETSKTINRFQYKKEGDGCNVRHHGELYNYIDEDFRTRCLKDFEIIMEPAPSGLDTLHFHTKAEPELDCCTSTLEEIDLLQSSITPFLESFEEFFTTRTPLKVRKLEIRTIPKTTTDLQENEVMKILPFLDPQILETIDLSFYGKDENLMMVFDEISKLKQWTNAKELIMFNCIILTPIQQMNITHFAKGDITVETISLEDLRCLKEGFQNNSTLEKFTIAFKECSFHEYRNDDIYQFMGIPHREANPLLQNQRNIWFYRMPNCNNILHILHFVGINITFARVKPTQVPENAWIHN